MPDWINHLSDEDLAFIKRFVLASGSLKEIARQYNVTYPTVRLRLDKLIQKIQLCEEPEPDPYIQLIKCQMLDGRLSADTAKLLIHAYKAVQKEETKNESPCLSCSRRSDCIPDFSFQAAFQMDEADPAGCMGIVLSDSMYMVCAVCNSTDKGALSCINLG